MERVEHMAWIAHLKGDLHALKDKLDFSKRRNNVADWQDSKLSDEYDLQKCQIFNGRVFSGEMVQ